MDEVSAVSLLVKERMDEKIVLYNRAEMRIWVDPTSPCGLRRAGKKEISCYGIKGKGI